MPFEFEINLDPFLTLYTSAGLSQRGSLSGLMSQSLTPKNVNSDQTAKGHNMW